MASKPEKKSTSASGLYFPPEETEGREKAGSKKVHEKEKDHSFPVARRRPSTGLAQLTTSSSSTAMPSQEEKSPPASSQNSKQMAGGGGSTPGNRHSLTQLPALNRGENASGATVAPTAPKSSGIAARRNLQVAGKLSIDTSKDEMKSSVNSQGHSQKRRTITWCEDIAALYSIGATVMPSSHPGMEVRFAKSKASGTDFVVKLREKKQSFQGKGDEISWRENTELVLNLPQCPGIATLREVLEDNASYYIVMEKAGGCDLYEALATASGKRLPPDEAKIIIRQLLEAISQLHAAGVIHKDLKLENVMIDLKAGKAEEPPVVHGGPVGQAATLPRLPRCKTSGNLIEMGKAQDPSTNPLSHCLKSERGCSKVKLIDFDTVEEWSPQSPKAKHVLGTDQYIAPEAYEGNYSPASDVFAAGVIAYRLLTGCFPFNGGLFDDQPGENWVGSPKMKEIKGKLQSARINWQQPVFSTEPGAQLLLARMLAVREQDRPTAKEALTDAWFRPSASARERRMTSAAAGSGLDAVRKMASEKP